MAHFANYDSYDEYQANVDTDYSVDVWDHVPGIDYLNDAETESAFYFFNEGWMSNDNDYEDRKLAREYFFEYMNMNDGDFPWEAWAEAMGYE